VLQDENLMETLAERNERYLREGRTVSGGKDHGQDVANQQRQQELDMQKAATDRANQQQDEMKQALSGDLSGKQGFDPALLSALQTQFLNQNDTAFGSANSALKSALLAKGGAGGNNPVGGDFVKGVLGLESAKAGSQAGGLNQIGISNLQQALQNKWNAANIEAGQPAIQAQLAGQGASGASSALGQYVQAKSIPGFGQVFGNAFFGSLGGALGGGVGGGIGKGLFPNSGQ
jgi:hypothetical protein